MPFFLVIVIVIVNYPTLVLQCSDLTDFVSSFLKWSLHPAGELKTLPNAPSLHRLRSVSFY